MSILGAGWWKRVALALTLSATGASSTLWFPARAQAPRATNALAQQPAMLPPTPTQGAWGEVIMANNRWMVVQNQFGQQFPIAMDQIGRFLIRWPTQLDALTGQSLVEALGPDQGNNTLVTDHVDVFEGADRDLVQPTFTSLLPNNRPVTTLDPGFIRFMSPYDIGSQNLLYGWAYPVNPGQGAIPPRLHVVGSVVNILPTLQVATPGGNWATVMPDGSMSLTRVTRGSTSFAQKGDLVFLMPTSMTIRSVVLAQAVLYKKIPFHMFRLN